MPFPISVCIITLNEEDNLEKCISKLGFASEIIIVDSGSNDRTLEIARSYKAKVSFRPFDNYVNQKNYALTLAQNDWVLALDADEVPSEELIQEIISLTEEDRKNANGFAIPRMTYYLGQWIRHGGWYPNRQVRLFRRDQGRFAGFLVHETVQISGHIRELKKPLYHFSYKSLSDHLIFINHYSTLFAIEKFKQGKRSGLTKAIGKSLFKLIWMYIFRLGFLDGKPGLVIAILGSYYNFLKYTKLFELERDKELASSLLVVVDSIHDIESKKAPNKNGDQVYIRELS
ncbi:glycosyltransferase family 2 protein [Leptospira sp. GIMC2001]|uniref:glycosyltransferase family 2 protein n=1 Tax=Leptospira sp. GIMC2001 TaxID=1513297 RepID=UPI002349EA14|nr:glycosyltransferase family 2 protein [Leptospira sp. GIMC2001]WCL50385.1 glycosyltransferase family 2 protein [Leptospira sp. GIMC2001]